MSRLFLICGLSFAGKSTLGRAIAERFGYEQGDVDEMKALLYGLDTRDEELTRSDWERIYAETDNLIVRHLQAGKTVVDASRNFKGGETAHKKTDREPRRGCRYDLCGYPESYCPPTPA